MGKKKRKPGRPKKKRRDLQLKAITVRLSKEEYAQLEKEAVQDEEHKTKEKNKKLGEYLRKIWRERRK